MRNKVLLALQNIEELTFLSENLQQRYDVFKATNKEEIDLLFEKVPIQLVICSVDAPILNGCELCSQLKSSPEFSLIPVIVLANVDCLQSKIESLEAGADAIIIKPFSLLHLEAQMKNLINSRKKISDYFAFSQLEANNLSEVISDNDFIKKLKDVIVANIQNASLNVNFLARALYMSRPTLYRRIKSITNMSPNDMINNVRLNVAVELISSGNYKVYEVAKMVGFHSQSSFGKIFVRQFNVTPTRYLQLKKQSGISHESRQTINYRLQYEKAVFSY